MSAPCVALVGAPNSGKTTLYNWLTGSRFKTVNYPGATVEYSIGSVLAALGSDLRFMDTPGVYGLNPKSPDEELTVRALYGEAGTDTVDGVLVVVDGTQLERHLQLVLQVRETGFPFVVVITMADLLRKAGLEIDLNALSQKLGAPVLLFDGLLAGGLREIVAASAAMRKSQTHRPPTQDLERLHGEASDLLKLALRKVDHPAERFRKVGEQTRQLDRLFLHPVAGPVVFFVVMAFLFSSIYWFATPLMDLVDGGFSVVGDWLQSMIPSKMWGDFAKDGVIASFAGVMVFVPQIFILFVLMGLLESTGYLARAATLIDGVFSKLGLTGRSFVPVLSGFSCAVPAMIASRNISSPRDRWITNFIVPLMTCSARLPVYAILLGFVFIDQPAWKAGMALASLYFGALFVGAAAAAVLNKLIAKDGGSVLMMELPLYRRPKFRVVLRQSLTRTWSYVHRAGPVIFLIAVVLWWGSNFPNHDMEDASARMEQSYAAQVGRWIEPVVSPMGVDWRVGVGLLSAFAAREVFVSTLAVTFHIADEDEDSQTQGLLAAMREARRSDGALIFTPATVAGLLIFFMIALQCMTTFAVAVRESGSWGFAVGQLVLFNVVAYVLAVGVVQGLRMMGVA